MNCNKTSNTLVSFDNNTSGCFWDSPATNLFLQYQFTKIPQKNHGQDKHEHTQHHQHAKSILQHGGDHVPQSPTKSTSSSWFKKQAVTSLSKIETLRKKIREISKQFSIHEIASKTNLNVNLSLPRPRQSRSRQNKYNKKGIKKSEMTTKIQTDKSYYNPPLSYNILSHICCR